MVKVAREVTNLPSTSYFFHLGTYKETTIRFDAVGWKSLLQTRAGTSRILILKSFVRELCLERSMPIYSYIGEDADGRPVMVSYLDGKPRIIAKNIEEKPHVIEQSDNAEKPKRKEDDEKLVVTSHAQTR